jgi:putative hydrolase of the HAD superfamily
VSGGIRAVFFDLDGTLLRDDHVDGVVREVARQLSLTRPGIDPGALADANRDAWWEYWPEAGEDWMAGRIPVDSVPREVWRRSLAATGIDDPAVADEAFALHATLESGAHGLYPESLDVLEQLHDAGYLLGLITNGPSELQRGKLRTVAIESLFDVVIVSGEVGRQKPEPEIFARALAAIGESADASVHVGDNLVADIGGARDAGMTAVWIDRSRGAAASASSDEPQGEPHHTISDLRELLALLEA